MVVARHARLALAKSLRGALVVVGETARGGP
jgi:hypothetical protein